MLHLAQGPAGWIGLSWVAVWMLLFNVVQAMGGDEVDARADIYSTGCVAYWLLTGKLVFTGDTPTKLLLAHAQTPPTPPSSRTEFPISC